MWDCFDNQMPLPFIALAFTVVGEFGMAGASDFAAQLAKQIGFLERSAKDFDAGHTDEAFRIATALRVIFHQTPKSTSLLTHLNATKVLIRSAVPDMSAMRAKIAPRKVVAQYFVSLATITVGNHGCVLLPKTEPASHHRMIPADEWWDEVFATINNTDYTRKALVLWACNKDGGAHVDDVLPPEYEAIKASGALGTFNHNGQDVPVEQAHLVFLRSMAFEVTASPDLRVIAGL